MTEELKLLIRMANTATVELMDRLPMALYDRRLGPSLSQLMKAVAHLEYLAMMDEYKGGGQ